MFCFYCIGCSGGVLVALCVLVAVLTWLRERWFDDWVLIELTWRKTKQSRNNLLYPRTIDTKWRVFTCLNFWNFRFVRSKPIVIWPKLVFPFGFHLDLWRDRNWLRIEREPLKPVHSLYMFISTALPFCSTVKNLTTLLFCI